LALKIVKYKVDRQYAFIFETVEANRSSLFSVFNLNQINHTLHLNLNHTSKEQQVNLKFLNTTRSNYFLALQQNNKKMNQLNVNWFKIVWPPIVRQCASDVINLSANVQSAKKNLDLFCTIKSTAATTLLSDHSDCREEGGGRREKGGGRREEGGGRREERGGRRGGRREEGRREEGGGRREEGGGRREEGAMHMCVQ
jgi:hypothetical protein